MNMVDIRWNTFVWPLRVGNVNKAVGVGLIIRTTCIILVLLFWLVKCYFIDLDGVIRNAFNQLLFVL